MGLQEFMKRDAHHIINNTADFSELLGVIFIAPDTTQVTIQALHTKHHLGFDLQTAQEINTLKAHVCVSEQDLIALSYPVRNAAGQVALAGHRIKAYDDRGVLCDYVAEQWYPNEKLGTISIILGAWEE